MGDALKQKMVSTITWSTIDRFGQQIIQFLSGLVFARLLLPEDFGTMGIIMIFVAISLILVESGFGQALIRQPEINKGHYTSVYYFNLTTAALLYLVLFFSAPCISDFFRQPQLTALIRVMSLVVIINSSYLIPYVQLSRALDFKQISRINIIAILTGAGLGVIAAFLGAGVWSLIVQQSVNHLLKMVLLRSAVRWKPSGMLEFRVIRELWKFSLNILFTSLVNILFNNLFIIILGRSYPKAEVGQFAQGNKLSETFSYTFQAIFAGSTFALFSQVQNDIPRFGRILGEMIRRTSLVTIPIICVLIASAFPLITVIWTEKFQPAVIYFQLMSLASILTPFYVMNINALNARGKSGKTMAIELIKKLLIVTGIFLLYQQGIVYMLSAYVAGSLLAYPVSVWFVKKELNQPVGQQLLNLLPGIITGILVGTAAALINLLNWPVAATLATQLAGAALLYLVIVRVFFRSMYDNFRTFIISKLLLVKSPFQRP
ncbi:MAG: lipopolysaccharide biosynthesis protein [Paludibacter sp.]|nr:lipopolysaccharide biosynthesis protein [Paludibacter sp.]